MKTKLIAATFAVALTLPAVALAENAMDTDGDGQVTMPEFEAAHPDAEAGTFSILDANADGVLSEEELAAAQEAVVLPSEG